MNTFDIAEFNDEDTENCNIIEDTRELLIKIQVCVKAAQATHDTALRRHHLAKAQRHIDAIASIYQMHCELQRDWRILIDLNRVA